MAVVLNRSDFILFYERTGDFTHLGIDQAGAEL
jgi:hypothetical protein